MTTPEPDDDSALDRRIRAASEVALDEAAVTRAVLARVTATRGQAVAPRRPALGAWVGPLAFASVLLATPVVVALYPASDEALILGLATGDPRAILGNDGTRGILMGGLE